VSEPKLISPMLDNYIMGGPISEHHGICCCPAMEKESREKFIVKVISIPASPSQIDALLLSGAFRDEASILAYFKEVADSIVEEIKVLSKLSEQEGFLPYIAYQVEPKESEIGFDVYLLSTYKRSLETHIAQRSLTHLDALNIGLDLCAALSVCRRSGYLCVDIKPSNIFVTDQRVYRIGDLGYIHLDSLRYTSLPEKYLSAYTPPEICDAFSALNPTMDIYAVGMLLYQIYNNGQLPILNNQNAAAPLPAPRYADSEMCEIILKACSPAWEDRWQDPMQMGQAIVSYMQRNGANYIPIVPVLDGAQTPDAAFDPANFPVPENSDADADSAQALPSASESSENATQADSLNESEQKESSAEEFTDYESISEEVFNMLNQADELVSHEIPQPVVVPESIEVPMPSLDFLKNTTPATQDTDEDSDDSNTDAASATPNPPAPVPNNKIRILLVASVLLILLAGLFAGGFHYYRNIYLLPIHSMELSSSDDSLTVTILTDVDESLLTVVCADTYGNRLLSPVTDGKAEFSGLIPNTAYSIKITAEGFHRLTGDTTAAFSTPVQTNIVQFDAVNGITDGSIILSFTLEGPDSKEWIVVYTADGEAERSATFQSHMVTLTGLTIGKEYTFHLVPKQELYITGQNKLTFTTQHLVKAENIEIVSNVNNTLAIKWTAPDGSAVESWSVRCSGPNYNQTRITTDTSATFKDVDPTAAYTIEVKAIGMSVSQAITVPANITTVSNFRADTSNPTSILLTWDSSLKISDKGWNIRYSIDGITGEQHVASLKNEAVISPVIPNATYHITIESAEGNLVLNPTADVQTGNAASFLWETDGFQVSSENLQFQMCKTPDKLNWTREDLKTGDYTTNFSVSQKASFLVASLNISGTTAANVTIAFIVRNENGTPISYSESTHAWNDLWNNNDCELDIPSMPAAAGSYTVEVYFNGGLAVSQQFTITA